MRALLALVCALTPSVASAGPWVLPPGALKLELVAIHWQADERFVGVPNDGGTPGERVPLGTDIAGAELTHQQVGARITLGLPKGLEVWAWMPWVRAEFADDFQGFETTGTGDPLVGLNWQAAELLSFGAELKIPVSDVPRDQQLPISEGQWDLTLWQRVGRGFGWLGWADLDVGYRLRFEREDELPGTTGGTIRRKPGNELLAVLGAGVRPGAPWDLRWAALTAKLELLMGADGEERDAEDNALQLKRREYIELQPGILVEPAEGLSLSAAVGLPLAGLNYPAGARVMLGVAWQPGALW
jgi:hypothetical protein